MSYLTQHRLLCDLSARRIRDTLEAVDLRTLLQVREHLEARGGDWEVLSDSGAIVQTLLDARSAAHICFDALSAEATARAAELPDRKAFALQYAAALPAGAERAAAFLVADGRLGLALETLTAAALDETVERLHQAETVAALDEPLISR